MSILFDDARLRTRTHGGWTAGLWLSVMLHALGVVVLIVVSMSASGTPSAPGRPSRMAFVMPATVPVMMPVVAPRLPAPPPPRPMPELARVEAPKPIPVAPIVPKSVEPAPAPLVAAARPIEKPAIQRPPETGLFERTQAAHTNQAAAAVTTGGFGTAATSPRGAKELGDVTTGGFGSAAASPRGAKELGDVKTAGFGSGAPAARRVVDGEVLTAGFDQRASAPRPAVATATKPADRPVEIVFKPTPEYTDEARSARIEGTVSLELEFTAAGEVRVLRVVRGLGHGLDEAAQRAALRMRFTPAQSDGRAVDSRATVHITFRLS
jgi:TonB family protein